MKSSCHSVFNHSVLLCPNLYSPLLLASSSLLQLKTDCKRPLLSPINLRRGPTENMSRGLYPLLCDITAYTEVCLPLRCLATDVLLFCTFASVRTCLTPLCLAMGVHVTIHHNILSRFRGDYRRSFGLGLWFTDHINTWLIIPFTDHWHTQTSVLILLQSPLAVSWQRILTQELNSLTELHTPNITYKVFFSQPYSCR
jgi:hypothetical protein